MKIAIFTECYPPSVGGQEIRFAEMAQVMIRRGHSVDVFCVRNMRDSSSAESVDGVAVHRYPEAFNYQQPLIKALKRRPWVVMQYAYWCRKQAREHFDLCLYNQWPLAHIFLAPSEVRSKAIADWCEVREGWVFGAIQRALPKMTAMNMAVSQAVKRKMESLSGQSFTYVPSGIFVDRYRSVPREQRWGILYIGRLTEHKNLGLLIEAFEQLRASGYEGPLRIAGGGPALVGLQKQIAQSPQRENIQLLGFASEEQKVELLSSAQVLVIPSRREGFPRIVAEAMASGLPTVTVDYPENGTRDVVREYGVGMVSNPDAKSLSQSIRDTLTDWEKYSQAGLSACRSLDWDVVVDELLRLPQQRQN